MAGSAILHSTDVKVNNQMEEHLANCKVQCKLEKKILLAVMFSEKAASQLGATPQSV